MVTIMKETPVVRSATKPTAVAKASAATLPSTKALTGSTPM